MASETFICRCSKCLDARVNGNGTRVKRSFNRELNHRHANMSNSEKRDGGRSGEIGARKINGD